MIRNLLILPDGEELFSGTVGAAAIRSVKLTRQVNSQQDLTPGSVCTDLLEATIFAPGGLNLQAGQEFSAWKVMEDGTREKMGIFIAQKPVCQSAHVYTITAYDRISLLDRDLTGWLRELAGWPYTLHQLAEMVCDQCGVKVALPDGENASDQLPNSGFLVQPFAGEGITGRQLMEWIGQALGRFCRMREDGVLEFAWYSPNTTVRIGPGTEDGVIPYFQGGLRNCGYTVAPVERVCIRHSLQDVGTVYPQDRQMGNTYTLTGNYLLAATNAQTLLPIAQGLYEQLCAVTYTPCTLRVPLDLRIRPGDILTVQDAAGRELQVWVMKMIQQGQQMTIECTGNPRRDSSAAVVNSSYQALSGKVMNLRADVDGLKAENSNAAGKLAKLELDLEGIRSTVATQEGKVSNLEQTAQGLRLTVTDTADALSQLTGDGVPKVKTSAKGYTFDDTGLTIRDPGQEIINLLDNTGMYVKRGADILLQANNQGVVAADVSVRNYLVIGHARFESYADGADSRRTACFYMEDGENGT